MTSDVIIIRFPDSILIDIREELYLFFLHFASKRVRIFLWLRCEHDCFFQIEQHTKALIRISHPSKLFCIFRSIFFALVDKLRAKS